jgi:hypothetical protein
MTSNDQITRYFSIVDYALRHAFPDSYWKRCMYAALGMRELLRADGIDAKMVYGDVACFTISPDAKNAGWQGFVNNGVGPAAHFWIETVGYLLDLGPHYLPADSRRPIAPLPLIRWPLNEARPRYLRYRERGHGEADMRQDPELAQRVADFVDHCMTVRQSGDVPAMPSYTWQLLGTPSLMTAARKGDAWAGAALQFVMGREPPPAPI